MFSSLHVIEDAEYTFCIAFQDQEYKVTIQNYHLGACLRIDLLSLTTFQKCFELYFFNEDKGFIIVLLSTHHRHTWFYDRMWKNFSSRWQKCMRYVSFLPIASENWGVVSWFLNTPAQNARTYCNHFCLSVFLSDLAQTWLMGLNWEAGLQVDVCCSPGVASLLALL